MCFADSRLWCWDATTQAASEDAPSQHRGRRRVLSFSFKVGLHQGRVALPCTSLRGVRAPNTSSPLRTVRPEYSVSIIQFFHPFRVLHSRGKNHRRFPVHQWKTFLMLLDLSGARHLRVLSMKPFHIFLRVPHSSRWLPSILLLRAAFLFYKIPKLFHRFIPSSIPSRVGNDITLDYSFYLHRCHDRPPTMILSSGLYPCPRGS